MPRKGNIIIYSLWILIIVFLVVCIIFPLCCTLLSPNKDDFYSVFLSSVWHKTIFNTFIECICSTSLSVLVGYIFAYAVVRGGIIFKKFFSIVPIIHLMTPPFVGGLSFILLAGRNGFITHNLLKLDVSLYGFSGLVIAQVFCFFPIAYLICSQVIDGINPALEQAARSMGASNIKIFFTVTLPLSAPGIISSFLFIAVSVLSDFGNPMIVAGRFRVLAVEIYTQLTGWVNPGVSAVLGLILLIPSISLFLIYNHFKKKNDLKTAVIGGKLSFVTKNVPSTFARINLSVFCFIISLVIFAQLLSIIIGSFQKLWGINTSFTLEHIKSIPNYFSALKNSLIFSFVASIISVFIASIAAFIVQRTSLPCKRFIDVVIQLSSAVSGSLFGLSFSLVCSKTGFYFSKVQIIIAMIVGFIPFSYRLLISRFSQIKQTLDDASFSLGAGYLKTLIKIIIPLSSKGIFSSFLYSFVRSVGTLSAVIFLISFDTPLVSVKILNLAEQGNWGKATALALVLTIITFSILLIGKITIGFVTWIENRRLLK